MKTITTFLLILLAQIIFAQTTDKEKALEMAKEAVKLMDEGKHDESIKILEDAKKLDPEDITYPYEIAYAYCLKKEYKKANKILKDLTKNKKVNDLVYQMLGNTHDYLGDSKKAIATYEEGLKLFPNSGKLHLELGNMHMMKNEYNEAIKFYEKGIRVEPSFPSNYYWAAKIFCGSDEEVWGMIYGEIFLNLERWGKRNAEISKLLYNTYNSEIKFKGDTLKTVSFSKNFIIDAKNLNDKEKLKLPFGSGVYEPTLLLSIIGIKKIDLYALNIARSLFIENYEKLGFYKQYPNVLFNYQKKVKDAGHIEAYNYWILSNGNIEEFNKWKDANKNKWNSFIDWFKDNGIRIDEKNNFYRELY